MLRCFGHVTPHLRVVSFDLRERPGLLLQAWVRRRLLRPRLLPPVLGRPCRLPAALLRRPLPCRHRLQQHAYCIYWQQLLEGLAHRCSAVDQRVSRLRLIGNEPPNAQQLRYKGDSELIRWHGELTGKLLRLFGFNLDLCPVLDISFDDEADNSLRGRCYGGSPEEVITNAETFRAAMAAEGILSCVNVRDR